MWQWLVTLVARPVLRPVLAVLVATACSGVATRALFAVLDTVWPTLWGWIKKAARYAGMALVTLTLTAFLFDLVLRQEQMLNEGSEAIVAVALNAGLGVHGALCSWPRVPRLFCPSDTNAPGPPGPVVIVVQAAGPAQDKIIM
jgi:hypothetical protein